MRHRQLMAVSLLAPTEKVDNVGTQDDQVVGVLTAEPLVCDVMDVQTVALLNAKTPVFVVETTARVLVTEAVLPAEFTSRRSDKRHGAVLP